MICVFLSLNCSYYTTGHLNPTLHCRDTWLGLTRITCKFQNANLWTFSVLWSLRAVNFVKTNSFTGERERDLEGRPAGSHHVSGLWLSRWRKGQSRESVTHERMMERFAALYKQLVRSGHIWPACHCCLSPRNLQQPQLSRQTLSAWSMEGNNPVSKLTAPITGSHLFFITKFSKLSDY